MAKNKDYLLTPIISASWELVNLDEVRKIKSEILRLCREIAYLDIAKNRKIQEVLELHSQLEVLEYAQKTDSSAQAKAGA